MAIITPTNKSVESLTGIHLYHTGMSNCAMRVRLVLEEKELPWQSHALNLSKGEHLTKDYFGINPNGVVPTLIDDGIVVIDSADIIDYLDKKFTPNSLRPSSEQDLQLMYEWMYLARDNHLSIKTYMYTHISSRLGSMKRSESEMAEYREKQTFDKALLEFHEKFNSDNGFSQQDISAATDVINACFAKMNTRLEHHSWLAGDQFSLADIAWIPQLVILKVAGYPIDDYEHLSKWKDAIMARPSFKKAVINWLPTLK